MIFICLAPQYKNVISRDIVKSMDKYVLLACAPAGLLCHMVFTAGHFHAMWPFVRIKTFSAHVELKNGHVVSKSGLFAHER